MTNTKTSKKQIKSASYQVGHSDGEIQGYLQNPKSDSDCFIRRTELQESDRKDYMSGFADGFAATKKFMGR